MAKYDLHSAGAFFGTIAAVVMICGICLLTLPVWQ